MRYRLRDSESPYKYANSVIDAWGNSALEEITVQVPHILANATIDGDGTNFSFDMSTKTRFHLMHRLTLVGANGHPIPEHPGGMEYIRAKNTGAGIIAGDPAWCVVANQRTLYLDAIIAATDDLSLDYWQTPRTWVETVIDATLQSTIPDGLLAVGWDRLILSGACIKAGEDIGDKFGDALIVLDVPIFKALLPDFEQYASKATHRGSKGQIRYSVMGADPTVYGLMGRG